MWFYPNLDVEDEGDEMFTFEAMGISGDYDDYSLVVTVTITNQGEKVRVDGGSTSTPGNLATNTHYGFLVLHSSICFLHSTPRAVVDRNE